MKKLKKYTAVAVSAAILVSAFGGMGAAAAEQQALISGDANLDGKISVDDVTAIQVYLAGMSDFSVRQEVSADFKNCGISIDNATVIQTYLAGDSTDTSVGQTIDEGTDGIIVNKTTNLYAPGEAGVSTESIDLYFSTRYNDVPFVAVDYGMDKLSEIYRKSKLSSVISEDGNIAEYITETGASVVLNYNENTVEFTDYDTFVSVGKRNGLDIAAPVSTIEETDEPTLLYVNSKGDCYYGGEPLKINLDDYFIKIIKEDGKLFMPLSTFNDIFVSDSEKALAYNGKAVFFTDYELLTDSATGELSELGRLYYHGEYKESLSEEMTVFNYYETCLNLDLHYGLKKKHDITTFDNYLTRKGLKKEYLSGNLYTIETANAKLSTYLFIDYHSSYDKISPLIDQNFENTIRTIYSYDYLQRYLNMTKIQAKRSEVLGENVEHYERRGNTVYITFDSFSGKSPVDSYYNRTGEYDLNDTVELFAYSLQRLQNEDKDVDNVVVDVSCNGGGEAFTCLYAISAINGTASVDLYNPNTKALHNNVMKADLNLDGVVDGNDKSLSELGKNIAVITSDKSFSCGNLLPCNVKAKNNNILLLGQKSGGGACVVHRTVSPTGSFYQISGEMQLVTMKNGALTDIDDGVAPDVHLTTERLFDRDYINDIVNTQFGVNQSQSE